MADTASRLMELFREEIQKREVDPPNVMRPMSALQAASNRLAEEQQAKFSAVLDGYFHSGGERLEQDVDVPAQTIALPESKLQQHAMIAALEYHYWLNNDAENAVVDIGGMGAAANICAAILQGKTPEQYQAEIEKRDSGDAADR